jgi:hypothetical protein
MKRQKSKKVFEGIMLLSYEGSIQLEVFRPTTCMDKTAPGSITRANIVENGRKDKEQKASSITSHN